MAKPSIKSRAANVRLLLFDVDGVLTDGTVEMHADGSESKGFHVRDGAAIVWARHAGLTTGLLTARPSPATAARAAQLAIRIVAQTGGQKLDAYREILRKHRLSDAEVAYMGDDLLDLPVLARVGLSAAPADAMDEVRSRVDFVARAGGGHGAARELVVLVLKAQKRWSDILETHKTGTR